MTGTNIEIDDACRRRSPACRRDPVHGDVDLDRMAEVVTQLAVLRFTDH